MAAYFLSRHEMIAIEDFEAEKEAERIRRTGGRR